MPDQPPTTGVALSALLADRELGLRGLYAAEDVAGPATVHAVHASEMADPSPYLLGGELLLTAGAHLGPDADGYVARLVAAGAAALGFGVAPVYEVVPPELVAACARHGLPLLEVPPGTPFTAVARTVWRLMAEARTRELRRVTEAQQALAAAAARPDPVPAVLRRLRRRRWAAGSCCCGAARAAAAGSGEAGREVPPGRRPRWRRCSGGSPRRAARRRRRTPPRGGSCRRTPWAAARLPAGPGPGAAAPRTPPPSPVSPSSGSPSRSAPPGTTPSRPSPPSCWACSPRTAPPGPRPPR